MDHRGTLGQPICRTPQSPRGARSEISSFAPPRTSKLGVPNFLALGGDMASELGPEEFEQLAAQCVSEYVPTDGARSLYRSVSTHLMEAF